MRAIVSSDHHHPFCDERHWYLLLQAAHFCAPDHFVINGDFADFYKFSRYFKDPRRKDTGADEIEQINARLDEVDSLIVGQKTYIFGNHEHRYDRYIGENAPELAGIAPSLAELLRLHTRDNWDWRKYTDGITLGKMDIIHDVGRCGKNTAQQSLAGYGSNVSVGHSHRAAVIYEGTNKGGTRVAVNSGCLLDFNKVDYRSKWQTLRDWQKGFVLMDFDEDGNVWAQFIPIVDNKCIIDGKVLRG